MPKVPIGTMENENCLNSAYVQIQTFSFTFAQQAMYISVFALIVIVIVCCRLRGE